MFTFRKISTIPCVILNKNFEILFYSSTAKEQFPKLRKGTAIKKCYPSYAWIMVENSLTSGRPASIYFELGDTGSSISFVPFDQENELEFYGAIHELSPTSFDPKFPMLMHDMKTPLSVIRNSAMLIKDQADPDVVEIIERNTLKLLHLVNNVGSLLNNTSYIASKGLMSLSALFEDLEKELQLLPAVAAISIQFQIQGGILIFGVYEQIERIAINLISNAIKFCKDQILISVYKNYDFVYFSVEDNGMGIPSENIPHLFAPWYSNGGPLQRSTGLGLTIAKEFTKKNDGKITVTSAPGKTVFTCEIPLPENINIIHAPSLDFNADRSFLQAEFYEAWLARTGKA